MKKENAQEKKLKNVKTLPWPYQGQTKCAVVPLPLPTLLLLLLLLLLLTFRVLKINIRHLAYWNWYDQRERVSGNTGTVDMVLGKFTNP